MPAMLMPSPRSERGIWNHRHWGRVSSAPTVSALEHMTFGAMTYTEFKHLSDGQHSHAIMAAFNHPPATVDDFAKLIKG